MVFYYLSPNHQQGFGCKSEYKIPKFKTIKKISSQLSGVAGEYYVAAELSRRGYLAAITLRNSDGVDILASSIEGQNMISIQVKTTQGKKRWILNQKIENEGSSNKYFIFVYLPLDFEKHPEFYIIHSKTLAKKIYEGHRSWLTEPGKNGRVRRDSNARQFDPKYYSKEELVQDWNALINLIENKEINYE